jgi:hypothetical protein
VVADDAERMREVPVGNVREKRWRTIASAETIVASQVDVILATRCASSMPL